MCDTSPCSYWWAQLIYGIYFHLWPLWWPQWPKIKMAAMKSSIFSFIKFYHTKTWCTKVWENSFWFLFDTPKGLYDPNDTNKGPETPRGHLKAHPYCRLMASFRFYHTETWCVKVFRYGKINFDIYSIPQKVHMTLLIQAGVPETPPDYLKAPHDCKIFALIRFYCT